MGRLSADTPRKVESAPARVPGERVGQHLGFLSRTDLADLGLGRRAVDAVFRGVPVVRFPGYTRPLIKVEDYLAYVELHTYRGDRVRPTRDMSILDFRNLGRS